MVKIPILICLPFWEGDKPQATDICRIIAGLQPHHVGTAAHVMLVARQDCKIDPNMVKIVAARFNVLTHVSRSPLKGWPQGPNGIFGSTMIHIGTQFKNIYECVYWLEPDAVPIHTNWFASLAEIWKKREHGKLIVGCRSDCDGTGANGLHITGCALYDPKIAKLMPYLTTCSGTAWDYQFRAAMVANGQHTNAIQNRYKQSNVDAGVIEEPGVVVIHGVKDDSITKAVRRKFKIA